jgi:L,D-peptidoglycan transpeptidase YkuD (ErfK/YbiS/YcfS/YnhG family)
MLRCLTTGVLAAGAATVLSAAPVDAEPAPRQAIVVSTPSADATRGTLTAWQREAGGWRAVLGPVPADLGGGGTGQAADDEFITPAGTFPLGQAFGREPNPGTAMPYFQATDEDWWDEDVDSPTYNTHVHAPEIASDDAENLYDAGPIYDYAVLIDHNPRRIPGQSAGIFLHVTDGRPTWGCVAVAREQMRAILQWLDPAAHPTATIRIGAADPPPP